MGNSATTTRTTPGYTWIKCSDGEYPENAVEGGTELNYRMFVARAWHEGALIPGKFHTRFRKCFIPWYGQELTITNEYEIMVAKPGAVKWVISSNGYTPSEAVVGGMADNGEKLFVGRAWFSFPQPPPPAKYPVFYGSNQVVRPWIIPAPPGVLGEKENPPPFHRKIVIPGNIQPSRRTCHLPWGGIAFTARNYETLVQVCHFKDF